MTDDAPEIECGAVRFYRPDRDFGFIAPDAGGPDVFVHGQSLRGSAIETLHRGDRVDYVLVRDRIGWQAQRVRLLGPGEHKAARPRRSPSAQADAVVNSKGPERGTVVSYHGKRGFGFIQPDRRDVDVFVHISRLQRSDIARLHPGDRVEFERIRGHAGWEAVRPRLIAPGHRDGAAGRGAWCRPGGGRGQCTGAGTSPAGGRHAARAGARTAAAAAAIGGAGAAASRTRSEQTPMAAAVLSWDGP